MKILLLDNYDSFTFNLIHYIESVSEVTIDVFRNDEISVEAINVYDKILLSPGAGLPLDAGVMPQLIKTYYGTKSILGVCLGHQAIAVAFGAQLINKEEVLHGVNVPIIITKDDILFKGIPQSFNVGCYFSWMVNNKNFSEELEVTAVDIYGNCMALRHKEFDVRGIQFHPESVLSEYGKEIMNNWINN